MAAARAAAGLSQGQLAKLLNESQSMISRLEAGDRHAFPIDYLPKLAGVLGVSIEWLLEGKYVVPPEVDEAITRSALSTADKKKLRELLGRL